MALAQEELSQAQTPREPGGQFAVVGTVTTWRRHAPPGSQLGSSSLGTRGMQAWYYQGFHFVKEKTEIRIQFNVKPLDFEILG